MKYVLFISLIALILILGCSSKQGQSAQQNEQQAVEEDQGAVQDEPSQEQPEIQESAQEVIKQEEKPQEAEQPVQNINTEPNISGDVQQLFSYAKTRLSSYSYQYKSASGTQYNIYVKGNKIKIDYISEAKQIYLNTQNKTAEEYCISHSQCGRQTGKIADLDYSKAYIETPIDWLSKITQAKKIAETSYGGKRSWDLTTNLGEVTIDSTYGFIYNINQGDKSYSFTNAAFNVVKDSDVNVPDYLVSNK